MRKKSLEMGIWEGSVRNQPSCRPASEATYKLRSNTNKHWMLRGVWKKVWLPWWYCPLGVCILAACQTARCVDCDRELLHLCFIYGHNTLWNCVIHTNLQSNTCQQHMAWLTMKPSHLGVGKTEDNLALLKCLNTGGPLYNLKETELEKVKDTTTTTKKKTIRKPSNPQRWWWRQRTEGKQADLFVTVVCFEPNDKNNRFDVSGVPFSQCGYTTPNATKTRMREWRGTNSGNERLK